MLEGLTETAKPALGLPHISCGQAVLNTPPDTKEQAQGGKSNEED